MRWRLTYVTRKYGISEDDPPETDTTHTWNMSEVESDAEAAEKTKTFLEEQIRHNVTIVRYELVRIVQEERAVSVHVPQLKTYGELRWPKVEKGAT